MGGIRLLIIGTLLASLLSCMKGKDISRKIYFSSDNDVYCSSYEPGGGWKSKCVLNFLKQRRKFDLLSVGDLYCEHDGKLVLEVVGDYSDGSLKPIRRKLQTDFFDGKDRIYFTKKDDLFYYDLSNDKEVQITKTPDVNERWPKLNNGLLSCIVMEEDEEDFDNPQKHSIAVLKESGISEKISDPRFNVHDYNWSPDGKHVAFSAVEEGGRDYKQIFVLDVDNNKTRPLFDESKIQRNPVWSPDGKRILYVAEDVNYHWQNVCLVTPEGKKHALLEEKVRLSAMPQFSYDGQRIAYATYYLSGKETRRPVSKVEGSHLIIQSPNRAWKEILFNNEKIGEFVWGR